MSAFIRLRRRPGYPPPPAAGPVVLLGLAVAGLLFCFALLAAGCAGVRQPAIAVMPERPTCAPGARPSSPEASCGTYTADGYLCARCEGTTGACVDLADAVYCVSGDCYDPACPSLAASRSRHGR